MTVVYAAAFTAVAGLAAGGFWLAFRSAEFDSIDSSLVAQARVVETGVDDSNGRISLNGGEPLPGETPSGIAVAAILLGPDGAVLDKSGQVSSPAAYATLARGAGGDTGPRTMQVAGRSERVLVRRTDLGNGRSGTLILARPVNELENTLARVAILLAVVVGGLVLGASALGYWLAGRALRPVRMMSATARDISEHDLHRRISLDLPPGDEIGELGATFNAMLSRLEAAFESLQRFTSDAAHDLRAPLALMQTQVEVILRRERTPEEYRASHRTLLTEIDHLNRLADQLLLLARADAGALTPGKEDADLPELLEDIIERWRPVAREQKVRLESQLTGEGSVSGDPDLLRRLFDNLLDNALRHTPAGGRVRVAAEEIGAQWQIAIEDTGPGVDPTLRHRLFERFTRADAARGRDTGGAGLGLSLCAAIARVHGGAISLDERSAAQGARFLVQLPALTQPAQSIPAGAPA